jgi:hypothetical protein
MPPPKLRNVYSVYNFGDFVNTESGFSTSTPFIQMLPLTNASAASAEFKKARAKNLESLPPQVNVMTINDPNPKPLDGSGSTGSPSGAAANAKALVTHVNVVLLGILVSMYALCF